MKKFGWAVNTAEKMAKSGFKRGLKTPEFKGIAVSVGISQLCRFTKGDFGTKRAVEAGITAGIATYLGLAVVNAVTVLVYNQDNIRGAYLADNDIEVYHE